MSSIKARLYFIHLIFVAQFIAPSKLRHDDNINTYKNTKEYRD